MMMMTDGDDDDNNNNREFTERFRRLKARYNLKKNMQHANTHNNNDGR